jgi:formyltetrahydrofolate-dependent phosphoribosylglycinamide formyltransferase
VETKQYNLAIFASGTGSNTKKIIEFFEASPFITVALIVSNKPEAGVLEIARANNISTLILEKERFFKGDAYEPVLKELGIDFIVLAGFLWKIPAHLIHIYPTAIINIHPALLPDFGGKGMYGSHVHEAVINAKKDKSGITIHFVDEHYDHGKHIFQATCPVLPSDTPETLANKIHQLEHEHFPRIIEEVVLAKYKSL